MCLEQQHALRQFYYGRENEACLVITCMLHNANSSGARYAALQNKLETLVCSTATDSNPKTSGKRLVPKFEK